MATFPAMRNPTPGGYQPGAWTAPQAPTTDYRGDGLSGPNRDAAVALTRLFESYGLGSLAPKILEYIQQGYSADTVSILLADTDEYKKRFKANEARQKAGLPVLSAKEYLATEDGYREVMQAAGLPKGFYDQPSDFEAWISKGVSPSEVKIRVDAASDLVNRADKNTLAKFQEWYTKSDMVAWALDPKRAAPLVGKAVEAAKIAGAAANQGINASKALSESLANEGITRDQALQGFGAVAAEQQNANKLASISGEQGFTTDQLASEVFLSNQQVAEKRQKLASQERGRFSGASGATQGSLSKNSGGL